MDAGVAQEGALCEGGQQWPGADCMGQAGRASGGGRVAWQGHHTIHTACDAEVDHARALRPGCLEVPAVCNGASQPVLRVMSAVRCLAGGDQGQQQGQGQGQGLWRRQGDGRGQGQGA
eukprot:5423460-Alexandrium_andersonii.AAC.1